MYEKFGVSYNNNLWTIFRILFLVFARNPLPPSSTRNNLWKPKHGACSPRMIENRTRRRAHWTPSIAVKKKEMEQSHHFLLSTPYNIKPPSYCREDKGEVSSILMLCNSSTQNTFWC